MNLKHTALVLLFLMCFSGYASAQQSTNTEIIRLIPVTLETVGAIQNAIHASRITTRNLREELDFFLSKSVSITSAQNNDSIEVTGVANGALVWGGGQNTSSSGTPIDIGDKGKLRTIDSDVIVIIFKEIPLKFIKNSQGRYDLFSAEIGVETNTFRYDGSPPQLLIIAPRSNERQEMQAVPDSSSDVSRRSPDSVRQPAQDNGGQSQNTNYPAGRSRNIIGSGSVTPAGVTAYVVQQNSSVDRGILEPLIETYRREAGTEGINIDIAIAQMLHWTNSLKNLERVRSHNYGGLSSDGLSWDGSFPNMTDGVIAHIQHLKSYASTVLDNSRIVDPRNHLLGNNRGRVQTFDVLYESWSPFNYVNYGNNINRILDELYRLSAG